MQCVNRLSAAAFGYIHSAQGTQSGAESSFVEMGPALSALGGALAHMCAPGAPGHGGHAMPAAIIGGGEAARRWAERGQEVESSSSGGGSPSSGDGSSQSSATTDTQ
ncbi:unnamed protein product [Amoebophrya sp. A120]|nr:unnamed protein product [Amoebophrya sp. A120]|eukprot:GSA120T00021888001.1